MEVNVPIHKLVSIVTDNAPAMTSGKVGLIGFCKTLFSYHCVIHQQVIRSRATDFEHVTSVVQRTETRYILDHFNTAYLTKLTRIIEISCHMLKSVG